MDILVIDDNAQVRKMLSSYLIKNGHNVEMANDGKQGWELIENSKGNYDLIFTDIKMPVMNGLELLERIKEKDLDIPVIIMTGYAVIELTLQAFKLGAYDFLTKPFEFKPLLATLEKIESLKADKKEQLKLAEYYDATIYFAIPSQTKHLKSLIPTLQTHFKPLCDLYKKDSHAIASSLFEVVRNAIVYGNLEVDPVLKEQSIDRFNDAIKNRENDPKYSNKRVLVKAQINSSELRFDVEDQGKGFDTSRIPQFDEKMKTLPTERGMFIVNSNMDEVIWNETGNRITMVKKLKS